MDSNKLHNHPGMESRLCIDKEHVIIDREVYDRLFQDAKSVKAVIEKIEEFKVTIFGLTFTLIPEKDLLQLKSELGVE
jgi:hypothetical protein